jgi:hypothetical protein
LRGSSVEESRDAAEKAGDTQIYREVMSCDAKCIGLSRNAGINLLQLWQRIAASMDAWRSQWKIFLPNQLAALNYSN